MQDPNTIANDGWSSACCSDRGTVGAQGCKCEQGYFPEENDDPLRPLTQLCSTKMEDCSAKDITRAINIGGKSGNATCRTQCCSTIGNCTSAGVCECPSDRMGSRCQTCMDLPRHDLALRTLRCTSVWQCAQPYTNLSDSWRHVSTSSGSHSDTEMDNKWYRFVGPTGNGLATSPPGCCACGTLDSVWMSGLDGNTPTALYEHCVQATSCCDERCGKFAGTQLRGKYPAVQDGVVPRIACADWGSGARNFAGEVTCRYPTQIQVVNCTTFYLFKLPSLPESTGYCIEKHAANAGSMVLGASREPSEVPATRL